MKRKQEIINIIGEKENELATLVNQSEGAIDTVRRTIDVLEGVNSNIQKTMTEIAEYQRRLSETNSGLNSTLQKNQQIMQNFKSLLCIE